MLIRFLNTTTVTDVLIKLQSHSFNLPLNFIRIIGNVPVMYDATVPGALGCSATVQTHGVLAAAEKAGRSLTIQVSPCSQSRFNWISQCMRVCG